jgi:hypothetical protein
MPPSKIDNHPAPSAKSKYWSIRASRPKAAIPPGRPSLDDLQLFSKYAENLQNAQSASGKRGLVLGSTRQTLDWCRERGLRVAMMDFCDPIAQNIQSAHPDWQDLHIIIDDWLSTAEKDGAFCWAAGDGVIATLGQGRDAVRLFRQIYRLLLPGSLVILRNFIRPDPTPASADLFAKLETGEIRSSSAFRIQLAQSLQPSFAQGVATREVYRTLLESGVLEGSFREKHAWNDGQMTALDSYQTEEVFLCYPTLAELRSLADPFFEELDISYGSYEMAELCPTLLYRTRITQATEEKHTENTDKNSFQCSPCSFSVAAKGTK